MDIHFLARSLEFCFCYARKSGGQYHTSLCFIHPNWCHNILTLSSSICKQSDFALWKGYDEKCSQHWDRDLLKSCNTWKLITTWKTRFGKKWYMAVSFLHGTSLLFKYFLHQCWNIKLKSPAKVGMKPGRWLMFTLCSALPIYFYEAQSSLISLRLLGKLHWV